MTIGLLLSVVAALSFLWFVAVIRRMVGDREDRFFATVFFGSGILLTGVMLIGAAAIASPALTVDLAGGRVPDTGVLTAISGYGTTLLLVVLLRIQAVFVISTSTLVLRSNAFSRWLSYFGFGIAFAMFFVPILTRPLCPAFPIWVGVLSGALFVRRSEIIPDNELG